MGENEQSTAADDSLNQAAAEAVETSESVEQVDVQNAEQETAESAEETETSDETNGDGLPVEQKSRSDLGRKVAAIHRRLDEQDNKWNELLDRFDVMLSRSSGKTEQQVDYDEPLTRRDLENWQKEQETAKQKQEKKYNDSYNNTMLKLGAEMTDDDWNGLVAELKNMPPARTNNPSHDAELNFFKAQASMLKKAVVKPAERKNPLKGETPKNPTGVITNQKTVVKDSPMPKLDGAARSYLDFIAREDGDETAKKRANSVDG